MSGNESNSKYIIYISVIQYDPYFHKSAKFKSNLHIFSNVILDTDMYI